MGLIKTNIVEDIRKEFGLDVSEVVEKGILNQREARKWLVKQLYYKWAKGNRTYTDIKYELSDLYDVSVSSIEKWVYKK